MEANWFAAFQEIPRISRSTKVHYRAHKFPPPVSIPGPPNLVHIRTSHLLNLPSGLFPSGLRTKNLYTPLSSPIRATYPAHFILLDFIIRTILGEEYRSLSSSLYNLLHSPLPRHSYVQIFSSTPYSQKPRVPFLPQCQRPSSTPIQNNRQNYSSIYLDL